VVASPEPNRASRYEGVTVQPTPMLRRVVVSRVVV
jgi:hypothetical protein